MAIRQVSKLWVFESDLGAPSCTNGNTEFIPLFPTRKDANTFLKTSNNKSDMKLKLVSVKINKYENNRVKKLKHKAPKSR